MTEEEAKIHGRLDAHRDMLRRVKAVNDALCWATITIGGATSALGLWAFLCHCSH